MKKTFILLAAAAIAAAVTPMQAKDIDQVRIYINPGHGGWGSGDRHMGTIKHGDATYSDTLGFYETNTNTWKGLATFQRLVEYGFKFDPTLNQCPEGEVDDGIKYGAARDFSQNVVMSHVKNGLSRNLTEISTEVEMNNFDVFLSIHSNAHVDGNNTNYPAMFLRGENKTELSPGSIKIAQAMWPYAYSNTHQCWSNYSMTNVALYYDIDFWGGDYATNTYPNGNVVKGYYGVLRHTVPGILCEGYFHTYQPARHRAMNHDVCRIEGEAYARGLADLLGAEKEKTGDIYGIVRDYYERFQHKYYNCSSVSADAYKPLNNAVVTLLDANREKVAEYTTDDEWNGAFVFRKLPVGTYYINVTCEGYNAMDEKYEGPYVVKEATTLYPDVYLINEGYEPPAENYVDYPDENDNPAIGAASSYNMNAVVVDKEIAQLEGTKVKRVIARGDNLYVLAHKVADKEPVVLILDAKTLDVKDQLTTEGAEGTHNALGDIAMTADGVLIGCATELCHSDAGQIQAGETKGLCHVYRWDNDETTGIPAGNLRVWFDTEATANFYRGVTGSTLCYTGTSEEGTLIMPSYSTYYSKTVWFNAFDIFEGKPTHRFKTTTHTNMNIDALGEDFTYTIAPNVENAYIVNSPKIQPMMFSTVDNTKIADMPAAHINAVNDHEGYFKYSGHSYMVHSDIAADGVHGGVTLRDITSGIHASTPVQTTNTAIEGASDVTAATAGRTVITRDQEEKVTSADIDLYVVRGNKASRFTTTGVEQPVVRGNYAYGLKAESTGEGKYTLHFTLTDAADATINFAAADEATTDKVDAISGHYNKGENTVDVDMASYEGNFNWSVTVDNDAVPAAAPIYVETDVDDEDSIVAISGVAINLDPESEAFGKAYISQYKYPRGIRVFNPDFTYDNNGEPYMPGIWDTSVGASPWRLALLPTGKLLISDWGDKTGGLYLFDPANPESGRSNFFAGTCNPASGEWTYEGKVIGGSTSSMAIVGKGEDTKMISFQEDWPSDYSLNLVSYNIGTKEQIDFQPEQSEAFKTASAYLINGNVDVIVRDKGMLLGQVRGAGNNTKGVPSFLITDPEGKILFNSGESYEGLNGSVGGFAMNADASMLYVSDPAGYIRVCSLTWEPEFTLTELYKFDGTGSNVNNYQMAFDPAGNLYVANREALRVYTLPRDAKQVTTPAPSTSVLAAQSAVVEISVDEAAQAPARYYDMQGREHNANSLVPGVYVRKQGAQASKVIVK